MAHLKNNNSVILNIKSEPILIKCFISVRKSSALLGGPQINFKIIYF